MLAALKTFERFLIQSLMLMMAGDHRHRAAGDDQLAVRFSLKRAPMVAFGTVVGANALILIANGLGVILVRPFTIEAIGNGARYSALVLKTLSESVRAVRGVQAA